MNKKLNINLPEEGEYLIMTKSRKFNGEYCFLVDRNKCKDRWWTSLTETAIVFNKLSAAEWSLNNYTHNDPIIVTLQEAKDIVSKLNKKSVKTIITQTRKTSWMERRLNWLNYMIDNYDVSWEHGSNYTEG